MKPYLLPVFRYVFSVSCAVVICVAGVLAANPGKFLLISDVHFNPFENDALTKQLAAAPVQNWETIFESSPHAGDKSYYGNDCNYGLLISALEDAAKSLPTPDFILYPGDFLAHKWYWQYTSCTGGDAGFEDFTRKVIEFMGIQFAKYFGSTPILPTLGNDDAFCGDYLIQPKGAFLSMFAGVWQAYLGPGGQASSFSTNFPLGGYFDIKLPQMPNHRLIVLNTVLTSHGYPKGPCDNGTNPPLPSICTPTTLAPGACELAWLKETLKTAKGKGETVWLLMHIPPGINSYNATHGSSSISFWDTSYTAKFFTLLQQYGDIIQMSFSGHTHMDDFRIIDYGTGLHLTKIAPAISPIFGNNPGYQVYDYDRSSGVISSYKTHYLDLVETGSATENTPTCYYPGFSVSSADTWQVEYDFGTAYGQSEFSATSVNTIFQSLLKSGTGYGANYAQFYGVSVPGIRNSVQAREAIYRCCVLNLTPSAYTRCAN